LLKQQFSAVVLGYTCPTDWNYYNSFCYYVSTVAKKQSDARSDCQGLGGDLVSVEDDDEMNFITSISYVLRCFALFAVILVHFQDQFHVRGQMS